MERYGSEYAGRIAREAIAELKAEVETILQHLEAKRGYDPNQPRWSEGTPQGGRWRDVHGKPVKVAAFEESNRTKCDLQRALDEELCAMQLGSWCWDSAADRWLNCMRGVYVPPLKVGRR
jgi:hypothetical protein